MTSDPATDAASATEADAAPSSMWHRFGWVMAAIWIVFLVFPYQAVLESQRGTPAKVAAQVGVIAFAVVYVGGQIWLARLGRRNVRTRWLIFVALVLIGAGTTPVLGLAVLGYVPYLVSYAALSLPQPASLGIFVAGAASSIGLPLLMGQMGNYGFLSVIVLLVGIMTTLVRISIDHDITNEAIKEQLLVVGERERVARDVHDVLGHSLTVVTVKAELAARLIEVDPKRAAVELEQIQSLTRQALAEVRATVGGLRVARLGEELEGARGALHAAGIEAQVPDDASVVDPRYRIVFAWVLREAITNVVRHSQARSCVVSLSEHEMSVADDGIGLASGSAGNGLRGIRERVAAVSGRLDIAARPGGGTVLTVKVAV